MVFAWFIGSSEEDMRAQAGLWRQNPSKKKSQDLWFPETLKVTELGRVGFPQPSGLRSLWGAAGGKGNPRILGNHFPKYFLFHRLP